MRLRAAKGGRPLGKERFNVPGGMAKKIPVRLNRAARKTLASRQRLKAVQIVPATDGFGHHRITSRPLLLRH